MNSRFQTAEELARDPRRAVIALSAFFKIAEKWGLTSDEQMKLLGSPARSTFFKWKKEPPALSPDTMERLSHVFSIYKALEILFPDPQVAESWIRRPNSAPFLVGKSALERMLRGQVADLYAVRQYLDAQRGG